MMNISLPLSAHDDRVSDATGSLLLTIRGPIDEATKCAADVARACNSNQRLIDAVKELRDQLIMLRADAQEKGVRLSNERVNMTSAALLIDENALVSACA